MTKMRFSCPLCGAKQEADNMNEGVFCPCCGTYIDVARYFGRPDVNKNKGNISSGIRIRGNAGGENDCGRMTVVYASPDVMMRRSREREDEKNHVKDEGESKYFKPASMFPLDDSSSASGPLETQKRPEEKAAGNSAEKADRPYPFNHSGTSSDGSSSQMMFRPQWDQTPMRQLYATPPFVEEERRRRREGLSTSEGNGNKDEK